MDPPEHDFIKQREIVFRDLHPNPNQAHTAAQFLVEVEGMIRATPVTPILLEVSYDLLRITLKQIEDALGEIGLHIDNSLLFRLRRALYHYSEDTQRQNLGCERGESNCTNRVFALRYRTLNHGCRDCRPEHWRRYL
jgi:hypothetical protein